VCNTPKARNETWYYNIMSYNISLP
jgi:hypothetical protein